jgi:Tfp pilus assembly protein PilF
MKERPDEGLSYCMKAHELSPNNPKYSYALAFYQAQKGDRKEAVKTLRDAVKRHPGHADAALLLGEIYEQEGKKEDAKETYRKALSGGELSDQDSRRLRLKLQAWEGKEKGRRSEN